MTFSPKVWGDALRRLQDEIPDFAFDAWIAPLSVKVADGHLALGCQNSFHRDRLRNHYADVILDCWRAAQSGGGAEQAGPGSIELLTMKEFSDARGLQVEAQTIRRSEIRERPSMRRVTAEESSSRAVVGNVGIAGIAGRANLEVAQVAVSGGGRAERFHPITTGAAEPAETTTSLRVASHPKRGQAESTESTKRRSQPSTQTELPFSFESFVVGPCNALAREAALALARGRQRSLNQLYLAGESGMGKTHLARATAAEARRHQLHGGHRDQEHHAQQPVDARARAANAQRDPSVRVVYTSAEQFTSEFVTAMRLGNSEQWQRRYRGPIGMLIVEDVQFFSGRTKTQLELFNTVQHVLDAGGSVLLTGDRSPRDLGGLDERMRDQVGRGFVAELERPDALVRRHLLRSKAAAGGVHLPPDCLDLLVESSAGSVRDVESMLIQVVTTASLLGRAIDLDLTLEAIELKSGAGSTLMPKTIATSEVVRIVASFFGKRPEALAGRSRRRDVLIPRQLAMYLAHRYTEASLKEIGRSLGRDHPAVRNAISRIERLVLENAPLRYQVEALSERLDQTLKRPDQTIDASTTPH